MKVLRSTLVAAVAVIAAACGDKVTVPGNTVTPGQIRSVTVTPAATTLNQGQAVNLAVSVVADSGLSYTVTWTTSSSAVTLSAQTNTGATATAGTAASPGVAVCAKATAPGGQTGQGCASIVVGGSSTTNASLSIASITGNGGLNCPIPVPPATVGTAAPAASCNAAVNPQLDVRMNLTANSLIPEEVDVMIDNVVAAKQTYSAGAAAALMAGDPTSGPQTQIGGIATVVVSIAINACKSGSGATLNQQVICGLATGQSTTPAWLNGNHTISAQVIGHFAGGANGSTTNKANQQIALSFANFSGFIGALTVTGTNNVSGTGTAVDGAGYLWKAGTITVVATPIIYTAQVPTTANIAFGASGCLTAGGTRTLTNIPIASGTFTAVFSSTSTTATGNITGTEHNPALVGVNQTTGGALTCGVGGYLNGGEAPNITAVGADNDQILMTPAAANGGAGFLNALVNLNADPAISIRLDNAAPATGTCLLNAVTAPGTVGPVASTLYPDGAILVGNALSGNLKLTNIALTNFAIVQTVRKNGWVNGAMIASSTSTGSGLQSGTDRVVASCPDLGSGRLQSTAFPTEETVQVRTGAISASNTTIDATNPIANFAGIAETSTPVNQYRARVAVKDKVGNARTSFTITNIYNDAAVANAGAHAILTGTAPGGGIPGIDPTAAQVISAANLGSVAAFDFGVDLTPPTVTIVNPLQVVNGTTGAPCAGRYTVTAAQPCTGGANPPNTIYLANDPASPANGAIGSLFYTANNAPMWMAINRRDASWTLGLIAGQVSGNVFYCDNGGGTGASATTAWLSQSSNSCNTWPQANYNQGRVYAANQGIGTLTQPQDPNINTIGGGFSPYAAGAASFSGYYTQTGFVVDQAGNPTGGATIAPISNTIVVDNGLPSVGAVAPDQPFLFGGMSVNFTSIAADQLDIAVQRLALEYGTLATANQGAPGGLGPVLIDGNGGGVWAAGGAVGSGDGLRIAATAQSSWFWQQDVPVNVFPAGQNNNPPAGFSLPLGAAPLSINNNFRFPVTGLITDFELTNNAGLPAGGASFVGATGRLNTALGQAVNQALTPTPLGGGTGIPAASMPCAGAAAPCPNYPAGSVPIDNTGAANHGPGAFYICQVSAGANVALPTTCTTAVANPVAAVIPGVGAAGASFAAGGSFTISAIATGATLVFTNPFSQVNFYAYQNASQAGQAGAPASCLAATEGWRLIGVSNSASVTDNAGGGVTGTGRNWIYTITWTPNISTAPCYATAGQNYRIVAVGIGGTNLTTSGATGPGMVGTGLISMLASININLIP